MNDAVCDSSSPALTGEQSAHTDEIAQMRLDYSLDQRVWDLLDETERLRDALGVILDGLSDALGDPMGARPSQVTTLYSVASHALRPIQSGSSGGEQ